MSFWLKRKGSASMSRTDWIRAMKTVFLKHSPEILTGIGISGMLTTTILAVRATPKAHLLIAENNGSRRDLTSLEVIKLCWRFYVPSAITGVASIACLIGASSVNGKRNAALATAYTLSETALREYRDKVVETIGKSKEGSIRDEVAKERIANNPVSQHEVLFTDRGNTLCYDSISGRYFRSDIENLRKAENEINRRMRDEIYIPLNEFYDEIGLAHIGVGDDLGWTIDRGYLELYFSAQLTTDGATPCLVMDYALAPEYGYKVC
jgi:hypothetical protein